jgi:hypothetical protein
MMLSIMVQTTVTAIGPLFGTLALTTMTPNTMLASPRGPNQPIKSFPSVVIFKPASEKKTGSIREQNQRQGQLRQSPDGFAICLERNQIQTYRAD